MGAFTVFVLLGLVLLGGLVVAIYKECRRGDCCF